MAEGTEETTANSEAAPVSSEESVLAQLESLMNDDGTTAEAAPIPEEKEEAPSEDPDAVSDPDSGDDSDDDKGEEPEEEDSEEEDSEGDEEDVDEGSLELSEEQIVDIFGLDDDGVKITDEGELQFKVVVDKEASFVPLKDMVNSYQFESHLRQKSQKDAEERKTFQELKTAETEKLNTTMTDAVGLVSYLEQQLTTQYSQEQLNQLRATNPGEFAAVQQDISKQSETIAGIKAGIHRTIQEQQQQAAAQAQSRQATYVTEQTEKLYEVMPTWIDEKVAAKEYTAMKDAVVEAYGFTEEELLKVNDHRIIRLMLDAVKGSAVKSDSPLKKRLKKVPKIVKSGSPKTTKATATKKQAAAKRLRIKNERGSVHSIASALEDMISIP